MKTILLILFLFTACPYGISFGQDEFFFLFDEDLEAPSPTATSNNYYWFDGVNDIMVMATQDTVAAGAFSLEWYGAIYDFSTYPHLFCGWINGNTPDNTLSYLRWTNTGAFMNGETQTNADAFQLDYAFQDSTLYDVVVTWASDKEWKMYVNGTLADSATTSDDTIRVKQLGGLVAS